VLRSACVLPAEQLSRHRHSCGEVPERSNGAVSKTVVPLAGDRGFESLPLRQEVCLTGAFYGYRRKRPGFAGSVSLDETRERDALATSQPALAPFLCQALILPGLGLDTHSVRGRSSARQEAALIDPVERQIEFGKARRSEFDGLPALQDRLDQLGAQKGEVDEAPDIAAGDASRLANSRSDRARPAASSSNHARPRAIALISVGSQFERSFCTATPCTATARPAAELVWVAADFDRTCGERRRGARWWLRGGLFASPVSAFAALVACLLAIVFVLWIRTAPAAMLAPPQARRDGSRAFRLYGYSLFRSATLALERIRSPSYYPQGGNGMTRCVVHAAVAHLRVDERSVPSSQSGTSTED
jgi:hypothetical protein